MTPKALKSILFFLLSAFFVHAHYCPAVGRFINRDPIEEQGGLNLYGFSENNGVNNWDYLGQETVSVVYRTLIESPTVTFFRRTFNGGVKTVHGFTFDTISRNMSPISPFVGETVEYDKRGKVKGRGRSSGSTLKVRQTKNETCLIEFEMTGDERNPLAFFAPAITYSATVTFDYNKMEASVGGTHDRFPSHALKVKGNTVYHLSHLAAGTSPLGLFDFGTGIGQRTIKGKSTPFTAK